MTEIDDTHSVARFCPKKTVTPSGDRISGAAFKPRPVDKGKLSTNWIEYITHHDLSEDPIQYLKEHYERIMKSTDGSRIACLNKLKTIEHVRAESTNNHLLSIYHNGSDTSSNPSHSVIERVELDEMEISDLIAETVTNIHNF